MPVTLQAYQCNNSIRTKTNRERHRGEQKEKNERLKRVNHLTNRQKPYEQKKKKIVAIVIRVARRFREGFENGENTRRTILFCFCCRRRFRDGHTVRSRTFGHGRRENGGWGRVPPFERHKNIILSWRSDGKARRHTGRAGGRRERRTTDDGDGPPILTVAGTSTTLFRTSGLPIFENGLAVNMMLLPSFIFCSATSLMLNGCGRVVADKTVRDDDGLSRTAVRRRRRTREAAAAAEWTDRVRPLGKLSQTAGRTQVGPDDATGVQ